MNLLDKLSETLPCKYILRHFPIEFIMLRQNLLLSWLVWLMNQYRI